MPPTLTVALCHCCSCPRARLQVLKSQESRKTPRDMLDRERTTGREWPALLPLLLCFCPFVVLVLCFCPLLCRVAAGCGCFSKTDVLCDHLGCVWPGVLSSCSSSGCAQALLLLLPGEQRLCSCSTVRQRLAGTELIAPLPPV